MQYSDSAALTTTPIQFSALTKPDINKAKYVI